MEILKQKKTKSVISFLIHVSSRVSQRTNIHFLFELMEIYSNFCFVFMRFLNAVCFIYNYYISHRRYNTKPFVYVFEAGGLMFIDLWSLVEFTFGAKRLIERRLIWEGGIWWHGVDLSYWYVVFGLVRIICRLFRLQR